MALFKEILVPADYTEGTETAVRYGRQLAVTFKARVDVLHVWKPPVTVAADPGLLGPYPEGHNAKTMAEHEANRFLDLVFTKCGLNENPRFRKLTAQGVPTDVILERSEGYDLVIMATHGRSGLSRVMLGSVAEKVVRHATCPVLVVHQGGLE